MKGYIEFTNVNNMKTLVNLNYITTIWEPYEGKTSFHIQGDPISQFFTVDIPYEKVSHKLFMASETWIGNDEE